MSRGENTSRPPGPMTYTVQESCVCGFENSSSTKPFPCVAEVNIRKAETVKHKYLL